MAARGLDRARGRGFLTNNDLSRPRVRFRRGACGGAAQTTKEMRMGTKRVFLRSDGYTERDLLQSATDHLASARRLFEGGPRCFDSAGYLSHLGIELILKAFLLHRDGEFPGEHS